MRSELKKPTLMPWQVSPVQAEVQALIQASMLGDTGSARILPCRISAIGFSEVTTIT